MLEYDVGVMHARSIMGALENRYALGFDDLALTVFIHRVMHVMEQFGLRGVEGLLARLSSGDPLAFASILKGLIPSTTDLFRDPATWLALRDEVLPLFTQRGEEELRVWIAGYDSGEELYSLCVLLDSVGLLSRSRVYLSYAYQAPDFSDGLVLPRNRSELNLSNAEDVLGRERLPDYLEISDSGIRLRPDLVAGVQYVQQPMRFTAWVEESVHLILCRNHMIYYSTMCCNANLGVLAEALVPGGSLVVGVGENLANYQNGGKFTILNRDESIYRRLKG